MSADNRGCTCPKFVPSNTAMPSLAYDPNCPMHGSIGNPAAAAANTTVTVNYPPSGNNSGPSARC